jgi:integrase
VPPTGLTATSLPRHVPHLYSESDLAALLDAAGALHPSLRAATYRTLVGLMAATGIRRCEAISLDRDNVDLHGGLLTIRNSKFNKARQLPLHPSTVAALRAYSRTRDRLRPQPKAASFFVSTVGTRLLSRGVCKTFRQLVDDVGLQPRAGSVPPRMHDLRHSFAVSTLLQWYRDGGDVAARMPLLSVYLGHAEPASTYWYLQDAPELLALERDSLKWPRCDGADSSERRNSDSLTSGL